MSQLMPSEVPIAALPPERLAPVVGAAALSHARERVEGLARHLDGRRVWHVNSTATGGGVAEMLPFLGGYMRAFGVDVRWLTVAGDEPFFAITKRLHHALHGSHGDGSPLGQAERAEYERVMRANLPGILEHVRPNDIVILHDPQTAGLASGLIEAGACVMWRCHIGHDRPNGDVDAGWRFLEAQLAGVDHFLFSRRSYAPAFAASRVLHIVPPSIDPLSPKNEEHPPVLRGAILRRAGLVADPAGEQPVEFLTDEGLRRRVERRAALFSADGPPAEDVPLIVQISRWDPLKDPLGVIRGFGRLLEMAPDTNAELMLAGPDTRGVADDPEAAGIFEDVRAAWEQLPDALRRRVHLAMLPMEDTVENAVIVNALQRHAAIIVQKSLHEGFGLTVTEAMWKGRPVVASRVGGIQDQITHEVSGLLLDDPTDLDGFAALLRRLLENPGFAAELGANGRESACEHFLPLRHVLQYAAYIEELIGSSNR